MALHRTVVPSRVRAVVACALALMVFCLLVATPAANAQTKPSNANSATSSRKGVDADKVFGAVVKVSVQAIPDARSAAVLPREREGSGVVIGDRGLILTIGYLIVEADDVSITDSRGRTYTAWCARSRHWMPSR